MQARLVRGEPLMVPHTPGAAVNPGAVVVVGGRPYIAHGTIPIPANELGSVAAQGGTYQVTTAVEVTGGTKVFWNATTGRVTTAVGSHPHFGWVIPGSGTVAAGGTVEVIHQPDGTATAGS